jgi:AraC family transcriptional regulator
MNNKKTNDMPDMERFHSVIAYINEQIVKDWAGGKGNEFTKALSIKQILCQSDKVYLSQWYFQQFFHRMSGECIGAYINNLRMEKAAHLLQNTNLPVLHIANTVGYDSENALFKPFKQRFQTTPLRFRKSHKASPLAESFPVQTSVAPEKETLRLPPQNLIYRTYIGNYSEYNSITFDKEAWDSLYEYAETHKILPSNPEYYGICLDDSNIRQPNRCRFYACITVNSPLKKADGVIRPMQIEGGKYNLYKYLGSYDGLDSFYQAIFHKFDFELRDDFILERYPNSPQESNEEALITEVLIPVVK